MPSVVKGPGIQAPVARGNASLASGIPLATVPSNAEAVRTASELSKLFARQKEIIDSAKDRKAKARSASSSTSGSIDELLKSNEKYITDLEATIETLTGLFESVKSNSADKSQLISKLKAAYSELIKRIGILDKGSSETAILIARLRDERDTARAAAAAAPAAPSAAVALTTIETQTNAPPAAPPPLAAPPAAAAETQTNAPAAAAAETQTNAPPSAAAAPPTAAAEAPTTTSTAAIATQTNALAPVADKEADIATLEELWKGIFHIIIALGETIDVSIKRQLDAIIQHIDRKTAEVTNQINAKTDALTTQIANVDTKVTGLLETINAAKKAARSAQAAAIGAAVTSAAVAKEMKLFDSRFQKIEAKLEKFKTEPIIAAVKQTIEDQFKLLTGELTIQVKLDEAVAAIKAAVDAAVDQLPGLIIALRGIVEELNRAIGRFDETIRDVKADTVAIRATVEMIHRNLEEFTKQYTVDQTQNKTLQKRILKLVKRAPVIQKKLQELTVQLKQKKSQTKKKGITKAERGRLEAEAARLQAEAERLKAEAARSTAEAARLQAEVARLSGVAASAPMSNAESQTNHPPGRSATNAVTQTNSLSPESPAPAPPPGRSATNAVTQTNSLSPESPASPPTSLVTLNNSARASTRRWICKQKGNPACGSKGGRRTRKMKHKHKRRSHTLSKHAVTKRR
jgi:hypothetical protein